MALIYSNNQHYSDIASAIRDKLQSADTFLPSEMAGAIAQIPLGGQDTLKKVLDITGNGVELCLGFSDVSFLEKHTTKHAKTLNGAFRGATISEIPDIDTTNCEDFGYMFAECPNIETASIGADKIGLNSATSLEAMFALCTSLLSASVTNIPLSCTTLADLFDGCTSLGQIQVSGNTTNILSTATMFRYCHASTYPLFDTSSVTNMSGMFAGSAVVTVPAYDCTNVTNFSNIFDSCTLMTSMNMTNIGANLDISAGTFSQSALNTIILNLRQVVLKTLVLGADNMSRLTQAQITIATDKGWTLAE